MSRRWVVAALILQAAALALVLADTVLVEQRQDAVVIGLLIGIGESRLDSTFRVLVILAWALVVPGYALVVHLRLDAASRVALSVATSLAVALMVAQSLVWLDLYSLGAVMAIVATLSTAGLVACLPHGPRPPVARSVAGVGGETT